MVSVQAQWRPSLASPGRSHAQPPRDPDGWGHTTRAKRPAPAALASLDAYTMVRAVRLQSSLSTVRVLEVLTVHIRI
jgi:hypothetical protein